MMNGSRIILSLLLFLFTCLSAAAISAQSRDHLTLQEVDLVKEAQILDQRIEVFVKAADRRLLVLKGVDPASGKQLKKDVEKWGELPAGSRAELVSDIAHILDEAITNIDDVSSRDERNPLIPKALRRLAVEVARIEEQLAPLAPQAKGDAEVSSFELLNENAQSILEAANKLPPEVDKKTKAKADKVKN